MREPSTPSDRLQLARQYPLFDAIINRRARRFPVGATLPGGFNAFSSDADPQPLDDIEEALVAMSGIALTGRNYGDLPYETAGGANASGNTMLSFAGRAYASACAAHGTYLAVTNDDETYLIDPDALTAEDDPQHGEDPVDVLVRQWAKTKHTLLNERVHVPKVTPLVSPLNQWNYNVEGSTVLMPITDVTVEYINLIVTFLDAPRNVYLYDDMSGQEPLADYADKGLLDRSRPMSLSEFERAVAVYTTGVEQALVCQNAYLVLQSLGLGGWLFGAAQGRLVMGALPLASGLGFRCVDWPTPPGRISPDGSNIESVPVGVDGKLEALVPPNVPTMGDAVTQLQEVKWGSDGIFSGHEHAFLQGRDTLATPRPENWCIEAAQTWANYLFDQYGRFPVTMDPLQMGIFLQAHHLETKYYDEFHGEGNYPETVATHQAVWHGEVS